MAARKAPRKTSQFHRATHQPRSEETAHRILDAAVALFRAGTLGTTPVPTIAAEAGVSVGGFYARFRSRDDLQRAVVERLIARSHTAVTTALSPEVLAGLDARGVVRAYAEALTRMFGGRDRAIIRRISDLVRTDPELPSSQAIRIINQQAQSQLRDALLARRGEIGHADAEAAIGFADLAMSATARELLFFGGTGLCEGLAKDEVVAQLTELGCRYLQIP